MINRSPSFHFEVRQGNPLSPFLFVLAIKGLGHYLKAAMLNEEINGVKLSRHIEPITHQQFADDKMLMGQPTIHEALAAKRIFDDFKAAFKTSIKLTKSQVFFFNMHDRIQAHLARVMGF